MHYARDIYAASTLIVAQETQQSKEGVPEDCTNNLQKGLLPGIAAAIAEQIFVVEQPTSRLIFSGNLIVVS